MAHPLHLPELRGPRAQLAPRALQEQLAQLVLLARRQPQELQERPEPQAPLGPPPERREQIQKLGEQLVLPRPARPGLHWVRCYPRRRPLALKFARPWHRPLAPGRRRLLRHWVGVLVG